MKWFEGAWRTRRVEWASNRRHFHGRKREVQARLIKLLHQVDTKTNVRCIRATSGCGVALPSIRARTPAAQVERPGAPVTSSQGILSAPS